LVVSLIFFILTSLAFAVVAYLFYDESKQSASRETEAKKAKETADSERDKHEVARIIYALYAGTATPTDIDRLVNLQKHANYNDTLGTVNAKYQSLGMTWDGNTTKPIATFEDRIRKLQEDNIAFDQKLKAETAAKLKAAGEYVENINTEVAGKNAAIAAQKKATEAEVAAKAAKSAEILAAFKQIEDLREDLAKLNKLMENKDIDSRKQIAALIKSLEEKDLKLKKLLEEIESKREAIASDKPHGRITKVDNREGIAWISIGSADFVRPQLTFSIAAPNALTTSGRRERKGAVEVTKVLGEHLSQVKIIDVTNATQDPILEGDQIFNPAWDPTRPLHIAISGHIDYNGDGFDDTPEIVRSLQKQGIIVDAWLDLKEIKIEGKGISGLTDYLVIGDSPQSDFEVSGVTVGNREKRKELIREKMEELRKSADEKAVEKLQWRRFLGRIGYPLPKGSASPEFNPPGTIRQKLPGETKPDDKKDEKKDDKKDEGK
jgi:hypothetical protein